MNPVTTPTVDELLLENEELRRRLEEAEDALRALRAGEIDAVFVESGREHVFTLETPENSYRLLVSQVPNAAATLTVDGKIIVCNRRFSELLHRSLSYLRGKHILDIVAPDSHLAIEMLIRDGRVGEAQETVTLLRGDGTPVTLWLGVNALHEGAHGACLMIIDRTEQRRYEELQRAQKALSESERHSRQILDALPVAVYTTDAQGRLTYFNPAAVEFSGREPQLGTDQWCVTWKLYHADGSPMAHDECPMAVALREGRAVRGVEAIAERPDGRRIWFVPYPTPLIDAEGRVAGGINMLLDITERKEVEKTRALMSLIVDSSDDAIISKTLDGVIMSWNRGAERLFGYTPSEAIGQSITMLIPRERLQEEPAIIERLRAGESVDHFDTIRIRKDGSTVPISLTISPVRDAHGRIIGASKIARDITGRMETERALRDADRRKDEFLATLAHELRNPLAPIRNAVHILLTKGAPDPQLVRSHKMIDRQVRNMARLLDDLLDVSRISRNKLELRQERVELRSIVEAALEISSPVVEAGGHTLSVTLPDEPVHVDADTVRLAQVFANLLNNAAKYTDRAGHITLAVHRRGGEVVVSVKDTGIGISAQALPRIFEIFSQAHNALERSQGGLGIGLSLVKGLVELHGGSVWAHSDGPGKGSEFIVRLPAVGPEPAPAPPPTPKPAASQDRRRILIVDDNEDSADSLAMLLKLQGHEVAVAYDGEEALVLAETMRPDTALLDLGMPKLDGFEVCRRIREKPWGRDIRLLAVTGWGQDEDIRRATVSGFDQHLVKPVDLNELTRLLATLPRRGAGKTSV